jgi:hypothetical protein
MRRFCNERVSRRAFVRLIRYDIEIKFTGKHATGPKWLKFFCFFLFTKRRLSFFALRKGGLLRQAARNEDSSYSAINNSIQR